MRRPCRHRTASGRRKPSASRVGRLPSVVETLVSSVREAACDAESYSGAGDWKKGRVMARVYRGQGDRLFQLEIAEVRMRHAASRIGAPGIREHSVELLGELPQLQEKRIAR